MKHQIICSDSLEYLRSLPDDSVDMIFGSPPYEQARRYGELGFNLKGQGWVDWAVEIYVECSRVSKGLVAWVVEGQTRKFRWSATPALLMADLHRRGIKLRKPPAFHRVGIPGSGCPDWLRNDYEFVVCSSKGRLPWSDNTAMGHAPKYPVGGSMSNRNRDGVRSNGDRRARLVSLGKRSRGYTLPEKSNPGNIIHCHVGGGHMGSRLAHENEAPFPEKLAEFFVRSFCPPDGTVLDPFGGSGTTLAVCEKFGRNSISTDIRESQCELMRRRLDEALHNRVESLRAEGREVVSQGTVDGTLQVLHGGAEISGTPETSGDQDEALEAVSGAR